MTKSKFRLSPPRLIALGFLLVILAGGGGAAFYFLVLKPKQGKKVPSDLDDFDLEDEEEYLTEDEAQ